MHAVLQKGKLIHHCNICRQTRNLPENVTTFVHHRTENSCEFDMDRSPRKQLKKNVNLWDGYVRLFAAETNNVEKSIPTV